MSIYFMDGKTFITKYINEDPRKVLRTQFVIVSSTIRKTGKYEKQVINANGSLYPPPELLVDYDNYKKNEDYQMRYKEFIRESNPLLATLVKYSIEDDVNIVFLCSEKEKKYQYLKLISAYVLDEFGYPMYNYKKMISGKAKKQKYDEAYVLSRCDKILKKAKKHKKERMLSTESGRKEYFGKMSKKEMKKKLQKLGLYDKKLTSSEMRELLDLVT